MIELSSLGKTYRMGDTDVRALRDVNLTIARGEFVAIMGPSGSGKSTLMHILGLLDRPDGGSFRLMGIEISRLNDDELAVLRSRSVGFVFQQFHLLSRTEARENVAMPQLYSTGEMDLARADRLLVETGLAERVHHKPNELSGGQQQRVAIARALVNDPELIFADEPTGNLDSASAREIMEILAGLHRRGKTVILVTHEPELAEYAGRVITLRDGVIQTDVRRDTALQAGRVEEDAAAAAAAERLTRRIPLRNHLRRGLGLTRQAMRTLRANKVRTGLSMLGILIGVAAVIAMLALGTGAKESIQQSLAGLGSNALMLMPGAPGMHGVMAQAGSVSRITIEDVDALRREIPSIVRIAPMVRGRVQVVYGGKNWNTEVTGTTADYAPMRASVPQVGRFVTADDQVQRMRVAVIGVTPMRELFGDQNPIGSFIRINRISFQVVGVLPEKGTDRFHDQDDVIIVPLTTAMYRLLGRPYLDSVNIEIATEDQMAAAQVDILKLMKRRHRLAETDEDSYNIRNLAEIQSALTATSRTMSMLLASIAVISLVVGGIGIMNIMLVSVTERTREIGLRKAVGARRRDIMTQFLTEALVISLLGGVIGILLGGGAALGMSQLAGWAVKVSTQSVALATIFSGLIGVVFGLWPARKAALLNPIEALRYE
ncbi:MAG TPA: ABC transporter permease [Kiritimatiellia bacterium]|nr:ABC transporter permease [Kiritimatiellia bacterium]